uniref:HMG box domain-containing protein n=1 Tax=Leptobrachium leishanense TaxID=445787 RepID=A0A8C5QF05_9ANUR
SIIKEGWPAVVWQKSKVSDHKMAIMAVLGTSVMSSMVPCQYQSDDPEIFISGYLLKSESDSTLTSLSSIERSFLFINQRPVQHKEITKMIRLYYSQSLNKESARNYPIFFLNIVLPTSCLDVNVTPDKTQVMIHDKESVLLAVEHVLKSVYPCSKTDQAGGPSEDGINDLKHTSVDLGNADLSGSQNSERPLLCSSVNHGLEEKPSDGGSPDLVNGAVGGIFGADYEKNNLLQNGLEISTLQTESQNDCTISFAIGTDILMDTQPDLEIDSPKTDQIEGEIKTSNNNLDDWSKGVALKNSVGEYLEPVKILSHQVDRDAGENVSDSIVEKSSENMVKKPSNVIIDKSGFLTPYDLISNKAIKQPMSDIDIFIQENRFSILDDNPKASIEDISSRAEEMWEQLTKEEKLKYKEKAAKDLQRYKTQTAKVSEQAILKPKEMEKRQRLSLGQSPAQKVKLKAPLSNQQILDKLFQSQVEKKKTLPPIKTVPITFALSTLKLNHQKLSEKRSTNAEEYSLISKLNYPGAWVVSTEHRVALLNPYRMEEALLYKRLVENHRIPSEILDTPIILNDRLLGGAQYLPVLLSMEKESPKLNGNMYFSDIRLAANGFRIKIIPGNLVDAEFFFLSIFFWLKLLHFSEKIYNRFQFHFFFLKQEFPIEYITTKVWMIKWGKIILHTVND